MDTLHRVGRITFEFVGEPELMDVHVFCTDSAQGVPTESDGESGGLSPLHGGQRTSPPPLHPDRQAAPQGADPLPPGAESVPTMQCGAPPVPHSGHSDVLFLAAHDRNAASVVPPGPDPLR